MVAWHRLGFGVVFSLYGLAASSADPLWVEQHKTSVLPQAGTTQQTTDRSTTASAYSRFLELLRACPEGDPYLSWLSGCSRTVKVDVDTGFADDFSDDRLESSTDASSSVVDQTVCVPPIFPRSFEAVCLSDDDTDAEFAREDDQGCLYATGVDGGDGCLSAPCTVAPEDSEEMVASSGEEKRIWIRLLHYVRQLEADISRRRRRGREVLAWKLDIWKMRASKKIQDTQEAMSHALVWTLTDAIPALIAFVLYGVFLLVIGYVAVFLAPIAACAASLFFTMVVVRFADHWMDNGSVGLSFDMAVQSSVEDLEEGWTWVFHRHRAPKSHEPRLVTVESSPTAPSIRDTPTDQATLQSTDSEAKEDATEQDPGDSDDGRDVLLATSATTLHDHATSAATGSSSSPTAVAVDDVAPATEHVLDMAEDISSTDALSTASGLGDPALPGAFPAPTTSDDFGLLESVDPTPAVSLEAITSACEQISAPTDESVPSESATPTTLAISAEISPEIEEIPAPCETTSAPAYILPPASEVQDLTTQDDPPTAEANLDTAEISGATEATPTTPLHIPELPGDTSLPVDDLFTATIKDIPATDDVFLETSATSASSSTIPPSPKAAAAISPVASLASSPVASPAISPASRAAFGPTDQLVDVSSPSPEETLSWSASRNGPGSVHITPLRMPALDDIVAPPATSDDDRTRAGPADSEVTSIMRSLSQNMPPPPSHTVGLVPFPAYGRRDTSSASLCASDSFELSAELSAPPATAVSDLKGRRASLPAPPAATIFSPSLSRSPFLSFVNDISASPRPASPLAREASASVGPQTPTPDEEEEEVSELPRANICSDMRRHWESFALQNHQPAPARSLHRRSATAGPTVGLWRASTPVHDDPFGASANGKRDALGAGGDAGSMRHSLSRFVFAERQGRAGSPFNVNHALRDPAAAK